MQMNISTIFDLAGSGYGVVFMVVLLFGNVDMVVKCAWLLGSVNSNIVFCNHKMLAS